MDFGEIPSTPARERSPSILPAAMIPALRLARTDIASCFRAV